MQYSPLCNLSTNGCVLSFAQNFREKHGESDSARERARHVCDGLRVESRLHAQKGGQHEKRYEIKDHFPQHGEHDGILRLSQTRKAVYERVLKGKGDNADHVYADAPHAVFHDLRIGCEQLRERRRARKGEREHERGERKTHSQYALFRPLDKRYVFRAVVITENGCVPVEIPIRGFKTSEENATTTVDAVIHISPDAPP